MSGTAERIRGRSGPAVFAGVLTVLIVASAVVLAVGGGTLSHTVTTPQATADGFAVTDDGTRYTVHPSRLRQGCPGGMDCIPAIDDPSFESANAADWLADSDLVIGLELDGEVRAYPLRILTVHEVVNDRVDGTPIAVTYCPLCRSGLVFSRTVRGETLTFGVSGKLLNANLVLYDRQTESYWSQLNGSAIVGPMVPTTLELLPSTITTWGQWRSAHPNSSVLSRNTGIYPAETYAGNPYSGYANSSRVGFGVDSVDDRLAPKQLVYGVVVGNASMAYPAELVSDADVINDRVGDIPVVVVENQTTGAVTVFIRRVDGDSLRFELREGELVDENGSRWSPSGRALDGPHEGRQLQRLPTHAFYWFAWSSFHPETGVYNISA